MHYPFQSTGRPISTLKRVVHSRLHDTIARFRTGVKFLPRYNNQGELTLGDSCRHHILWWYHVNKYRVMRGNRRWTPTVNSPLDSHSSFSALKPHKNAGGLAHTTGVHERNSMPYARFALKKRKRFLCQSTGKKHAKAQIRHTLGTVKARFKYC